MYSTPLTSREHRRGPLSASPVDASSLVHTLHSSHISHAAADSLGRAAFGDTLAAAVASTPAGARASPSGGTITKLTEELDIVRKAWRQEGNELRSKMVRPWWRRRRPP